MRTPSVNAETKLKNYFYRRVFSTIIYKILVLIYNSNDNVFYLVRTGCSKIWEMDTQEIFWRTLEKCTRGDFTEQSS